jgi:hypothetical protein
LRNATAAKSTLSSKSEKTNPQDVGANGDRSCELLELWQKNKTIPDFRVLLGHYAIEKQAWFCNPLLIMLQWL